MIKILKHGTFPKPENLSIIRGFKCTRCGCEFEADEEEYTLEKERCLDGLTLIFVRCPECKSDMEFATKNNEFGLLEGRTIRVIRT